PAAAGERDRQLRQGRAAGAGEDRFRRAARSAFPARTRHVCRAEREGALERFSIRWQRCERPPSPSPLPPLATVVTDPGATNVVSNNSPSPPPRGGEGWGGGDWGAIRSEGAVAVRCYRANRVFPAATTRG